MLSIAIGVGVESRSWCDIPILIRENLMSSR
jgi:hypothetical protein